MIKTVLSEKKDEILDTMCFCGKDVGNHNMKNVELCMSIMKLYRIIKELESYD